MRVGLRDCVHSLSASGALFSSLLFGLSRSTARLVSVASSSRIAHQCSGPAEPNERGRAVFAQLYRVPRSRQHGGRQTSSGHAVGGGWADHEHREMRGVRDGSTASTAAVLLRPPGRRSEPRGTAGDSSGPAPFRTWAISPVPEDKGELAHATYHCPSHLRLTGFEAALTPGPAPSLRPGSSARRTPPRVAATIAVYRPGER